MAEWAALEMRCAFTGTVGSNPTLTAKYIPTQSGFVLRCMDRASDRSKTDGSLSIRQLAESFLRSFATKPPTSSAFSTLTATNLLHYF